MVRIFWALILLWGVTFEGSFLRARLFLLWHMVCGMLLLSILVMLTSLLLVPVAMLL